MPKEMSYPISQYSRFFIGLSGRCKCFETATAQAHSSIRASVPVGVMVRGMASAIRSQAVGALGPTFLGGRCK